MPRRPHILWFPVASRRPPLVECWPVRTEPKSPRALARTPQLGRMTIHYADPHSLEGWDPARDLGFPGSFPYTRGIQPTMYRGRLWTMRQYAGFGTAAESNARYRYLLAQGVSGLSVAFDLPTQMGYDSDHPLAAGEVGRVGVAIDSIDDMSELFDGIPARPGIDVDDDQCHGDHPAGALRRRGAPPGGRPGGPGGNGAERHPQGVRRPRHLHLSAPALAQDRHRHLRVLRARAAAVEHDLDQRLSHPRGRLDRGRRSRVHVRQRDRLRAGGARRRTRRRSPRAAPVVLLQRAQRFSRGSRQVPRRTAPVGADHARAVRGDEPARRAAALPHPDRGQHADRPAARQQHRPGRGPGARRGARRHAVAALQRARRGAGAPDRGGGAHRAQDAADHRRRERRGEHGRSARRVVRDRGAHQRDRGRARARCSIASRPPAGRSRRSSRASSSARSRSPRIAPNSRSTPGSGRSSASTRSRPTTAPASTS